MAWGGETLKTQKRQEHIAWLMILERQKQHKAEQQCPLYVLCDADIEILLKH
jgi:hypothetical protein